MGVEGVHQKQWHIAAVLLVECLKKKSERYKRSGGEV
jgi:hypothetical protein